MTSVSMNIDHILMTEVNMNFDHILKTGVNMNIEHMYWKKLEQLLPKSIQHILFLLQLMAIDGTYDKPVVTISVMSLPSKLALQIRVGDNVA